jgi:VanZ family protein
VKRDVLVLWGPFLAALAVVFWLSSMSSIAIERYVWDKLLHAVGYAGLGLLALRAFHGGFKRLRVAPTLFAGMTVILWGISDEIHQYFVPGRDSSVLDVVADTVGFGIAVVLLALWQLRPVRAGRRR